MLILSFSSRAGHDTCTIGMLWFVYPGLAWSGLEDGERRRRFRCRWLWVGNGWMLTMDSGVEMEDLVGCVIYQGFGER